MNRFIQVNCTEGGKVDLRQSRAVMKYKPDIIFLEYPTSTPGKNIIEPPGLSKSSIEKYPWIGSDVYMWRNIKELRRNGYPMAVYGVDGPSDLVKKANIYPCNNKYPEKTANLFWWVRIYLRERFMARNIKRILKKYTGNKNPVILVFLQSFHWDHVKFLLSRPSRRKVWNFYFGRFKDFNSRNASKILKVEDKTLFKYW